MTTEEATTVLQIASTLDESENENLTTVATILRGMLREIQRTGNENTQLRADLNKMTDERARERSRPIPADRELMRLVGELIRWHGLRPLDKRPDHAAALVGAIKALRANQGGANHV